MVTFVLDLQRVPVEPKPPTGVAGHVHVREKVHLDLDDAVAVAGLAPSPLHIEAEPSRLVASHPCIRQHGKEVPDVVEDSRIGGRIGSRRSPDRALINADDLVDMVDPVNGLHVSDFPLGVVELLSQGRKEDFIDQAALAGSRNACHTGEGAERNFHPDVLEIVVPGSFNDQGGAVARSFSIWAEEWFAFLRGTFPSKRIRSSKAQRGFLERRFPLR